MSRPAYVLPEDAVSGSDPVTFAGFPGIWTPGVPIAVDELAKHGLYDADEIADEVEERGLPLQPVDVSGDEGAMPVPPNHLPSREEAVAGAVEETPRPRSKRQALKLARDRGFEFSRDDLTLAEINAELFADVVADAQPPLTLEQPAPAEGDE